MNELISTNFIDSSSYVLDSREVAEMISVRHADLLRSIESYIDTISKNAKLRCSDYFVQSTYKQAGNGKICKCYEVTKMGCEMLANKLTGQKGILFTAEYVNRFNQMEQQQKTQLTTADLFLQNALLMKQLETKQQEQQKAIDRQQGILEKQQSELNTLNNVCTKGTKRQKLNNLVRSYANTHGVQYADAWNLFKEMYNNAYHTNLKLQKTNYCKRNNIKKMSIPIFLEKTNQLDDALRVAEKM